MSGTTPVATWQLPDYTGQGPAQYKANIDGGFNVAQRIVDSFAPHAKASPAMSITVDAGHTFDGTTLTEVASQNSTTITAPVTHPRIDRVVADRFTGSISVITGTEASSPTPPAITSGNFPICQILLQTSSTSITNTMITDERDLGAAGRGVTGEYSSLTALLDTISTTQGALLYRDASAWQAIAPGTSGNYLKTQGASANPVWAAVTAGIGTVAVQVFTSGGTYTPTAGMKYAWVRAIGGGGSGSCHNTSQPGLGGGSGSYAEKLFAAATIGASQSVTIGSGGTSVSTSGNAGNAGGTTSLGSLISCPGGNGGPATSGAPALGAVITSAPTGGDINVPGRGSPPIVLTTLSGPGADGPFGAGGTAVLSGAGVAGAGYGSGGSGSMSNSTASGAGAPGLIIIVEYCS